MHSLIQQSPPTGSVPQPTLVTAWLMGQPEELHVQVGSEKTPDLFHHVKEKIGCIKILTRCCYTIFYNKFLPIAEEGILYVDTYREGTVSVEGVDDGSDVTADPAVGSHLCLNFANIKRTNSILSVLFAVLKRLVNNCKLRVSNIYL